MAEDVKSKISELEKELYSTDFKSHRVEDVFTRKEPVVAPSWGAEEPSPAQAYLNSNPPKPRSFMKKFFALSLVFFLIAVGVSAYIWTHDANLISGENIPINIEQPVAVGGGEPFETKFSVTNSNKVSIEAATLFLEFPAGFYSVPESAELPRLSKDLGIITPGQSVSETINTMVYGEENTNKEVQVTLEYRMAGSNATLKKTTSYAVKIASSPVNIKLSIPKEVSSGQEVEFTVDIGSNSKNPIGTLLVEASYPLGFTFVSANPSPTYDTKIWRLSGLAPQEKRTIHIRGVVEGQESEEKFTKISVGTESAKDEREIGIMYNATNESSLITKPFLAIEVAVNNNKTTENIASLTEGVKVDIFWKSNNPVKVTDGVIEVKLKGAALDKYSLYTSGGGFYRSVDNTIVWEKTESQDLATIDPGEQGMVGFNFNPIPLGIDAGRLIKNPQIIFEVRARARQVTDTPGAETISTFLSRNVKFETDIRLGAKGLFFSGPFQNTGPIPPQADKETTYTIVLTARNSANNISSTVVKTTLPMYVKWLGKISPDGEDIAFNESTGEVTWNVGRIPAGGQRDGAFQVAMTPSVSHINRAPFLTGEINIVAIDDFTKTEVHDKKPAINTYISGDPQFSPNDANVVN
ncbi:MAG: hypothetical protein WAZ40_02975 [Minisyncoccia bacterium]